MNGPEELGDKIKLLRLDQGISLSDLAREVGVSRPTVWAWESGKHSPRPSSLRHLAKALRVPEDEQILVAGAVRTLAQGARLKAVIKECRLRIAAAAATNIANVHITIDFS